MIHLPVRIEPMGDAFTKYHLGGEQAPWPFFPVIHHFTAPDLGDPHDHPWAFTSHVLQGRYVEEVFHLSADGSWSSEIITRLPGTSHSVVATHIHRLIDLPDGDCWTCVMAGSVERETRFWRFDDGVRSRAWYEPGFAEEHPLPSSNARRAGAAA
jgi:hypothetical protein